MSDFILGQRVRISDTLIVERPEHGKRTYVSGGLPVIKDAWLKSREVNEGVVVGLRTIFDYEFINESDWDEYSGSNSTYTVSTPVRGTGRKAALVAFDLRRKPVLVLPEHITALEES